MITLHIGTHKTGSKSIQQMLSDNRDYLKNNGCDVYSGSHVNPKNHTELHLACLRPNRDSFAKYNFPNIKIDDEYRLNIKENVRDFINGSECDNLVFTSEDLSWLRYNDEINSLHEMLFVRNEVINIIVYLREKNSFIQSYRSQILKKPERVPTQNKGSVLYVGQDTWLADYELLVGGYSQVFGKNNVLSIDYDEQLNSRGSIIPSFLDAVGFGNDNNINSDYFVHRTVVTT